MEGLALVGLVDAHVGISGIEADIAHVAKEITVGILGAKRAEVPAKREKGGGGLVCSEFGDRKAPDQLEATPVDQSAGERIKFRPEPGECGRTGPGCSNEFGDVRIVEMPGPILFAQFVSPPDVGSDLSGRYRGHGRRLRRSASDSHPVWCMTLTRPSRRMSKVWAGPLAPRAATPK